MFLSVLNLLLYLSTYEFIVQRCRMMRDSFQKTLRIGFHNEISLQGFCLLVFEGVNHCSFMYSIVTLDELLGQLGT